MRALALCSLYAALGWGLPFAKAVLPTNGPKRPCSLTYSNPTEKAFLFAAQNGDMAKLEAAARHLETSTTCLFTAFKEAVDFNRLEAAQVIAKMQQWRHIKTHRVPGPDLELLWLQWALEHTDRLFRHVGTPIELSAWLLEQPGVRTEWLSAALLGLAESPVTNWALSREHTLRQIYWRTAQVARLLIQAGADVNVQNALGETPLMLVVKHSNIPNVPLLKLLLKQNALTELRNTKHQTALQLAVYSSGWRSSANNEAVISALVKHGANIHVVDAYGDNLWHIAVLDMQSIYIAPVLRDSGLDYDKPNHLGNTPLHRAISLGKDQWAATLLNMGADPNKKGRGGNTALIFAVRAKSLSLLEQLLAKGAHIEAKNREGYTAFLFAVRYALYAEAEYLLTQGANAQTKNHLGHSALALAALHGRARDIRVLAKMGVKPQNELLLVARLSSRDYNKNRTYKLDALIMEGADVNVRGAAGKTPLMHAAVAGVDDHVRALISAGAKVDAQDQQGHTAFMLALLEGRIAVAQMLLEAGANKHITNQSGASALLLLAQLERPSEEHKKSMLWLVGLGLSPHRKDHVGRYALRFVGWKLGTQLRARYALYRIRCIELGFC